MVVIFRSTLVFGVLFPYFWVQRPYVGISRRPYHSQNNTHCFSASRSFFTVSHTLAAKFSSMKLLLRDNKQLGKAPDKPNSTAQQFCNGNYQNSKSIQSSFQLPWSQRLSFNIAFFIWKFATRSADRSAEPREKKASCQDR